MAEKTAIVKIRVHPVDKKAKNLEMTRRENIFLEHVRYCFSVFSMHGFNHIVWSNRSPIERLFWVCAVVGLAIFGLLKSYEVLNHYNERPYVIAAGMEYKKWKSEFPTLTVCQKGLNEDYLRSRDITNDSDIYEYVNDLAFGNYGTYHMYDKYANGSKREYLKPEEYLEFLLEAVPTSQGFVPKEQIFPLNQERPIYRIITERGICFTVNPSNGIYYTPEYFNSSAPYKYEPMIYNHSFIMMKLVLKGNITSDYEIAFHSSHDMIDIGTMMKTYRQMTIMTFTFTTMSVFTPEPIRRLSIVQRNCKLYEEVEGLQHSPRYTHGLCKMECRIKLCLKYCQCTPYYYRRNSGEKICDMAGMYCLSKYVGQLIDLFDTTTNRSLCSCLQNCDTTIVTLQSMTMVSWFADTRLALEIIKYPPIRYVRKLVFSKLDLFVQIGGILSLCLGCTILGLIEVVYFMTLRFYWDVIKGRSIRSSL